MKRTSSMKPEVKPPTPQEKLRTQDHIIESIREAIVDWYAAGAMQTEEEVDAVIHELAHNFKLETRVVRMVWLSFVRQVPQKGADTYVVLAKRHYNIDVVIFDLGQYSADHSNSCMFLTCAITLLDQHLNSCDDTFVGGLGMIGDVLTRLVPDPTAVTLENLVEAHHSWRGSTLGRVADFMRHAACQVLNDDADFFQPYYHSIQDDVVTDADAYHRWVTTLRGDEEGDELVILALARLCGMCVQPVQKSGYRVPMMDPTESTREPFLTYWGNDDKHWVWLKPKK